MTASSTQTLESDTHHERLHLVVDGTSIDLAVVRRGGEAVPILFLHGWGSCKEDYTDIQLLPDFADRPFIAYDAPGCGDTRCSDLAQVNIGFLCKTAEAVLQHFNIKRFHLVGHSMGGLTALQLAHRNPSAVCSFIDIKGNLGPEDCFISRQVMDFPVDKADEFLEGFISATRQAPFYSAPLYAAGLRERVQVGAIRGILESMVQLSDNDDLQGKFLALPFPKMFMYGEQHSTLSYLPVLKSSGVELAEIPRAGHFPMYSNPVAMWDRIEAFVKHDR
ncbi:alpha/beta hydrolase protein [Microdochium trichocladiopsis]|uniref:Alpha/beta hydrolase protein n=1 Tax=Microdochium trichocladiopsis TaxID=1682393 RepID=A0A9P9BFT2_9PEZI|nr:alpha/beta hydrolase protein [Microdochium trichocladiopsis]KAH7012621.1 alpha/beta hydrolase protein [Microdochium trichocladiopsis]